MNNTINLELNKAARRLFKEEYQINLIRHSVDNDEQKKKLIDFLNNSSADIKLSEVLEKSIEFVYK